MSPDYVTEKLWDGLTAGCVPVYMGAASALHMIPDRQGIILYDPAGRGNASTPQELADLLEAIGNDKERYEAMMRWKYRKVRFFARACNDVTSLNLGDLPGEQH